jgi:nudix-type nucleoside diphosphatase (YffH/AdpP family)
MKRHVQVLEKQRVFDDFFKIDAYKLQHTRFDGTMTPVLDRLVLHRYDAVAAVLWHKERERVILVEQFRPAVFANGESGWTLELPAGLIDMHSEEPAETMRRELIEETGYEVADLQNLLTFYPSIGSSTERLTLYYAEVTDDDRIADGGGENAGEDLRIVEMSREDLALGIRDGRIFDSKTIIGVQWFLAQ